MNVFQQIVKTINGNIHAQGVKINFAAWMVLGSEEWDSTSDQNKALAYQAALFSGWTDEALIKTVQEGYKHVDENLAKFTIDFLKELATEYPSSLKKISKKPKVTISDGYGLRKL